MAFEAGTGFHFGMQAGTAVPARPRAGVTGSVAFLTVLAVVVVFVVSPTVLLQLGFNYGSEGGGLLEKFHPSTFIILAAFGLHAVQSGNPVTALDRLAATQRLVLVFLIGMTLLLVQAVVVQHAPFSPIVDTFLPPVVFLIMVEMLEEGSRHRLARFVHLVFLANALLAYYEFFSGNILLPPIVGHLEEQALDWRAAALFGHPLANASLTGVYLTVLVFGGIRGLGPGLGALVFLVNFGAMFAFGGRAALVLLAVPLTLRAAIGVAGLASGGLIDRRRAILAVLGLPVLFALGLAAIEGGFFDKLLERFVEDNGSATTRIAMLEVFSAMPTSEVLFGPDQARLATELATQGLRYGIESFEIAFALTYGLVPTFVFFAALVVFCADLVMRTRPAAAMPLLFFFVVSSGSVSISAKTPLFSLVVLTVFLLLERGGKRGSATAGGQADRYGQ